MVTRSKFHKDFQKVFQYFPKLSCSEEKTGWRINGDMDICDFKGNYWNTFNIEIWVPGTYPRCKPQVWERSNILKREMNWHITEDGECCIDIEHRLEMYRTRGMDILDFIKNKVYPFFVNQVYKEGKGQYASGEYEHDFDGVVQFYKEDLNIHNPELAVKILQKLIENDLPQRNEICICGGKKYKECHYRSVEFLKLIPQERLLRDIEGFNRKKYFKGKV